MKRLSVVLHFVLCILHCFYSSPCMADSYLQRIEIPSSFNPVGSGARALGMGGAFIAIADDATAASWNPGGLIQLESPEISVVGNTFHRIEDNSFGISPDADGNQSVSLNNLNYLSAAYPFRFLNHNMIIALNFQHLYDFTRNWSFQLTESVKNPNRQNIDYQAEGALSAIGLAYCIQVTPNLSLGFTLNIWKDGLSENKWEERRYQSGSGLDAGDKFKENADTVDRYSLSGVNANFGILWRMNDKLTIGAVLKTPFTADIEREHSLHTVITYPDLIGYDSENVNRFTENAELKMPMSYGIGIAYRFSDAFTLSADIYRTEWNRFIFRDSQGNETSPITGKPADIDPTYQIRMGAEYLFIMPAYVVTARGGLFYDPAPAEGSPDKFFGFSLGSGIAYKWFIFDLAYQYRFGNNVGASILKYWEFSQDVREHTLYSSVIVHF